MRSRSYLLPGLVLALSTGLAACSGGGDAPVPLDAASIDALEIDALDAPSHDPIACGTGTTVLDLPTNGRTAGQAMADRPGNVSSTTCNGRGAETAYYFTIDQPLTMVASTVALGTTLDTVLYVRRACQDPSSELGCNDDATNGDHRSRLTVDLTPGSYYLVVDGRVVGSAGNYELTVDFYQGVGGPCTSAAECAPGYTCRPIPPSTLFTCQPPVCDDGRDDDGDGKIDYPADPGCTSPADATENDGCPSSPTCPQCADGVDNDDDGQIDYPMDPGCVAASSISEENCIPETDPVTPIATATTTGSTVGAGNDFAPTCVTNSNAPDRAHFLHVRAPLATLTVDTDTSSFDTVLTMKDGLCDLDVACDDESGAGNQSRIFLSDVATGTYALIVDGFGGAAGTYRLNVAGTYAAGAACDPAAPWFRCPAGFGCGGPAGAETCGVTACNDTVDADGDGHPGYPSDPGCTSIGDLDETDACPSGPGCPACGNDLDDDGDGQIDFPLDTGCLAASTTSESCATVDPLRTFTANVVNQSTAGLVNDVDLSCGLDGRDEIYRLELPLPLAELRADTIGSSLDAVLAIRRSTCAAADLRCDDNAAGAGDALVQLTDVAAGEYFLIVDDRGTGTGTYNLKVSGRYGNGAACDPLSTLFTCNPGFLCAGAAPTCVATACNDAIDADGDGRPGYPTDPGCTSIADNDETDTCPAGPGCPACGNGLDDDGDTRIDYPTDLGCTSAAGTTELECMGETDPLVPIIGPSTTGTTSGAANNFAPSCAMSNAPDRVHLLTLQVPVATLVVDTDGSLYDTMLLFAGATCAPILECDDDDGAGTTSLITRTNVTPGVYALVVDGFGSNAGAYTLRVRGTLASGASCNDPLVAAGVLTCATGTTCQANVCAP